LTELFRPTDQSKIRLAISLQRIDPADIPVSARGKPVRTTPSVASTSQNHLRKRTIAEAGFESVAINQNSSATQEQQEEEVVEEEVADELYCGMATKVAGVQYYTGTSLVFYK